jgi:hypothetical protein
VTAPDHDFPTDDLDAPVTAEAVARFATLQRQLTRSFTEIFENPTAPRTVLIVPSLSLDQQVMAKISGVHHYEERMLCLLLLLRMPRTQVIYVTSTPIPQTIIDYYLHLLPGIPGQHARRRLTLVSCDDASPVALTRKILERPRVLDRLRQAIPDPASAHMTCFTVTELERKLALRLNLPIYGCDPSLLHWGSKSGSRKIFREAKVELPLGFEDLADAGDVARALAELKAMKPDLRKAVVKINEGFSGEGNAVFDLADAPAGPALLAWVQAHLPHLAFEARGMTWDLYQEKLRRMGGIVEEFIAGGVGHSALMWAARITLPHFSVSSAISLVNWAGEPASTSASKSARRAFNLGSARPALISFAFMSRSGMPCRTRIADSHSDALRTAL